MYYHGASMVQLTSMKNVQRRN